MANILNNQILCTIIQTVLRRRLLKATIILSIKKRKYRKKKCRISNFITQRNMKDAYYVTIPKLLRDFDLFTIIIERPEQFEELLVLIAPKIKKNTFLREPIDLRNVCCLH